MHVAAVWQHCSLTVVIAGILVRLAQSYEGIIIKILANNFERQWAECRDDYMAAVERVGASGWYILGQEVAAFEEELAGYCGSGFAVGCGNGMDALEIALRVSGIRPGDRVLTTPLSAFPTTLGILRAGAEPVFCDVDEHGLMDPASAALALKRIDGIRAIMPVHLYGHLADIDSLGDLAERSGAVLIEDAAQAIGAHRFSARTGSTMKDKQQGSIACFSFYPTKNLGAIGDGGALIFSQEGAAEAAKKIRNYGQTERYVHEAIGLNSRLDELHAATLRRALLPRLNAWLDRRRSIAERYLMEITTESVTLLPGPDTRGGGWHLFPVLVDETRRNDFIAHLEANGVQAGMHYPILIPEQKAITDLGDPLVVGDLNVARRFCDCEVSLPIHPYLREDEVEHVIQTVQSWST